jgi:PAS domain S-box-containing protein
MKNIYESERNLLNSLTGLLSGFCLSVFCYIMILGFQDLTFSFHNILDLHKQNSIIYIVDFFPFLFSFLFFYLIGYYKKSKLKYEEELKREKRKIENALSFSKNLTHGILSNFEDISGDSNELVNSLNDLRETLIQNKQSEDLRAHDDYKRNWASEGLAMFGDMLRIQEERMEDLAYKMISNLVKYLKANQGGFFLVEGDSSERRYIQMIACHAYDRKKFSNKQYEWGEGLIGACAMEKKTIYLLDIPDKYLSISSGLGRANPNILVIVPLLVNNEVQGIIEIASFSKFEDFQIDFIEKVAESIAMTLSNIKGNLRTAKLLKETQAQAEELALQEEKVRQNMEELKATQEQAARQAERFISFTNSVNHTMIRAEYDKEGTLLYANTKFLKKLGYSGNREVEGRHISLFIHEKDRSWFNEIWKNLSQGGKHFEGYMKHITKQGQDLWTMATYTSIRRDDSSVEKILFLAIDTTEQKKQSLDFEGQISAINRLSLKGEFAPDGKLLSINDLFLNTFKFNDRELQQMSIFDFLDPKDLETFNELWEEVITGKPYQGQLKFYNKYAEEKWFRVSFTSVNDMYDEVAKVVFLANEITNEKIMEIESRKQTEQLKLQEEKLRFASIELNRKIEEKNSAWLKQKDELTNEIELYKDLLFKSNELVLSVDNSGIIIFINKNAENFWKIKSKEILGKPAMESLKSITNFPESLNSLIDPAKSKVFEKSIIELFPDKGKSLTMKVNLVTSDIAGKIVYTVFLNPVSDSLPHFV